MTDQLRNQVVPLLPATMREAILELEKKEDVPLEVAVPAAIATANMVAGRLYNVDALRWSQDNGIPISEFFVTTQNASSGKTTIYNKFIKPVKTYLANHKKPAYDFEKQMYDGRMVIYRKQMNKLKDETDLYNLPTPPVPPVHWSYMVDQPTKNGIIKRLETMPMLAITTSEGGNFVNSHDKRDAAADAQYMQFLCDIWTDGNATKDTGIEFAVTLLDRRVMMFIMIQLSEAGALINNPRYKKMGFDSRMLINQAPPRMLDPDADWLNPQSSVADIQDFTDRILEMAKQDAVENEFDKFRLVPKIIGWTDAAKQLFNDTAAKDIGRMKYEAAMREADDKLPHPTDSLIGKGHEHLFRLAATLCAYDDKMEIEEEHLVAAYALFLYYIEERKKLDKVIDQTSLSANKMAELALVKWAKENLEKDRFKNGIPVSTLERDSPAAFSNLEDHIKRKIIEAKEVNGSFVFDGKTLKQVND